MSRSWFWRVVSQNQLFVPVHFCFHSRSGFQPVWPVEGGSPCGLPLQASIQGNVPAWRDTSADREGHQKKKLIGVSGSLEIEKLVENAWRILRPFLARFGRCSCLKVRWNVLSNSSNSLTVPEKALKCVGTFSPYFFDLFPSRNADYISFFA